MLRRLGADMMLTSPIAYYFYRFVHGYENELQRLHLLRDTWEAIVDILHAVAVAECRIRGIALAKPLSFAELLSDSVAQLLINVERVVDYAAAQGHALRRWISITWTVDARILA